MIRYSVRGGGGVRQPALSSPWHWFNRSNPNRHKACRRVVERETGHNIASGQNLGTGIVETAQKVGKWVFGRLELLCLKE